MSLTFYYAPMSTAMITDNVLAELGVPCERVKLDLAAGDAKKADFLKINPNGRVPAIVHEGMPIWESSAITMYLGELFGADKKLYPAPGPKRGEAMKWIAWSSVTLAEAGIRLASSLHGAGGETAGDKAAYAAKARTDVASCLKILDDGLAGRAFLIGDYTLADTHMYGVVGWLTMMHVDLKPFSQVASWMQRCNARPALTKLRA